MTSTCFFGNDSGATNLIELCGPAAKIQIISPHPVSIPSCPILNSQSLTIKQACELDFAFHDHNDTILIYKNTLWACFTEHTYYRAGLSMKKIKGDRYFAKFDLTLKQKRLDWSLESVLVDNLEFLVPQDKSAVPKATKALLPVPPLAVPRDEYDDWAPHFLEWTALTLLNSPILRESLNPAICTYFEYPGTETMELYTNSTTGLITPKVVTSILDQALDWGIVIVQGFEKSPIAWNKPHHGGDFGYVILKTQHGLSTFKLQSNADLNP